MQFYCESITSYRRLLTREVKIGDLLLGNPGNGRIHPVRLQTMTTTDTMDTLATVEQSIRCIEAGAELVRITAPSKREAENLLNIKNELKRRGYHTPLVADIHFTPNAAEIAARIVEKVRVNPGNYVDKKKFELIEYSDTDYAEEIDRIRERFTPLIKICKEYGTAMRIGTNHGSLSDRIMSRYGDTPMGMVESAMEFLRIARNESYHNIVLSMKSSNPQVMVQAYRLLVKTMFDEFSECYPLHLGVTEAGDGEDGRIKSAAGIGSLLEDGLGDTVRVSLTEDPELEIPVCKDLVKRYEVEGRKSEIEDTSVVKLHYDPFNYQRRETFVVDNIGGKHVPIVIADLSKIENIIRDDLKTIGYIYEEDTDKWNIREAAADYIFIADQELNFPLPGTLKTILNYSAWKNTTDKDKCFPFLHDNEYLDDRFTRSAGINFVRIDCFSEQHSQPPLITLFNRLKNDRTAVICLSSTNQNAMQSIRQMFLELENNDVRNPVIIMCDTIREDMSKCLVHYSVETGALLLDGFGDGIFLRH